VTFGQNRRCRSGEMIGDMSLLPPLRWLCGVRRLPEHSPQHEVKCVTHARSGSWTGSAGTAVGGTAIATICSPIWSRRHIDFAHHDLLLAGTVTALELPLRSQILANRTMHLNRRRIASGGDHDREFLTSGCTVVGSDFSKEPFARPERQAVVVSEQIY
jgi:hypothetical protein